MAAPAEPRNPLYLLLLIAGVVFVVTALAVALAPVLEQKALEAGEAPPPSAFRDALRADGWIWLLVETAVVAVLAVGSMLLDRLRSLKKEREQATIPPPQPEEPPPQPPAR